MRRLLAWVTSFSRKDRIVNQAVRELTEIAQQRANLSASIAASDQAIGYQQARLRRLVREYLASLEHGRGQWSSAMRNRLTHAVLEKLGQQNLAAAVVPVAVAQTPRQAA